jgi:hypothetical protein
MPSRQVIDVQWPSNILNDPSSVDVSAVDASAPCIPQSFNASL